jgi:four helix bundle protein|tara:strand:+ start:4494 stop:4931 length:438 start_codon:yes stop_codon:yes gene_type:complete
MAFSHEKLLAYRNSIEFVGWVSQLLDELTPGIAVKNQLDRASTSVPLNLAEGNAKFYPKDRSKYFQIASSSAFECAACLDVIVARGFLSPERVGEGKEQLGTIVSLLLGLIRKNGGTSVQEEQEIYGAGLSVDEGQERDSGLVDD